MFIDNNHPNKENNQYTELFVLMEIVQKGSNLSGRIKQMTIFDRLLKERL